MSQGVTNTATSETKFGGEFADYMNKKGEYVIPIFITKAMNKGDEGEGLGCFFSKGRGQRNKGKSPHRNLFNRNDMASCQLFCHMKQGEEWGGILVLLGAKNQTHKKSRLKYISRLKVKKLLDVQFIWGLNPPVSHRFAIRAFPL